MTLPKTVDQSFTSPSLPQEASVAPSGLTATERTQPWWASSVRVGRGASAPTGHAITWPSYPPE